MPALLLVIILLAPLLAGCVPGGARSDGVPTADAPFTLTALDVGQSTFRFRCMGTALRARAHHGAVLLCTTGVLS